MNERTRHVRPAQKGALYAQVLFSARVLGFLWEMGPLLIFAWFIHMHKKLHKGKNLLFAYIDNKRKSYKYLMIFRYFIHSGLSTS